MDVPPWAPRNLPVPPLIGTFSLSGRARSTGTSVAVTIDDPMAICALQFAMPAALVKTQSRWSVCEICFE